jgi:hypothetical protein
MEFRELFVKLRSESLTEDPKIERLPALNPMELLFFFVLHQLAFALNG